jgi:chromosome segregation ATPase
VGTFLFIFSLRVDFNICEQTTFLKTAKNMEEQGKGILSRLHENEMIASKARNELARINMEKLNVQQNISQLKNSLQEHLCKLKSIDLTLTENEAEIKRSNSEINKNMNNIDKLNRKYQKILEGAEEGEPVGPLEATIKSLSKQVDEQEAHASQAQKDIDANEAALIDVVTELESIHERITMNQAKLNVLNHKRLRLEQEAHTNEVTTTSLRVNIQRMHTCMPRLNDLIKQNSRRQTQLCSEISIKEKELMRASKDFELENSNLMVKITETKASKNKILSELVEVEHKLLSWEKSIQLEKETQATLKSLNEESDIVGMEKEIHRMKHKLVQLNRKQEFMVRDMERAIARREDIAVKYSKSCKTKGSNNSSKTSSRPVSCGGFEQIILGLKRELESLVQESNEVCMMFFLDFHLMNLLFFVPM